MTVACFLLLGAAYAIVTPVGESPDEAAHIAYVDHVVRNWSLPPVPRVYDLTNYESHQPPLDYVLSAAVVRVFNGGPVAHPFRSSQALDFEKPGSRAFAVVSGTSVRTIVILRLIRLLYGVITIVAAFRICDVLDARGKGAAAALLLAPQFVFISASVNNDASLAAAASIALLLLLRASPWSGLAFGVALFCKGSALFLLLPATVCVAMLAAEARRNVALRVAAVWVASATVWGAFNGWRFGRPIPTVPSGASARGWQALISDPGWPLSLWASFWARFGWLNTPLWSPFYLWFLIVTVACAAGVVILLRKRLRQRDAMIVIAAFAGNLLLVMAYMARIDWQPQGRYLFPSIAALAVFIAVHDRRLQWVFLAMAVAVCIAGALRIALAYSV